MDIRYWIRAAAAFGRNASRPGFLADVARSGLAADLAPRAPSVFMIDKYPRIESVSVDTGTFTFKRSNQDPLERFFLAVLCQIKRPRRIFEFGTFDGATTLLLARQAPDAEVLTLDLPPEAAVAASVAGEADNAATGVGSRFAIEPEAERITQLLGDSRLVDLSPWHETIDLVVVDGGHTYDCVTADTQSALRLVKPEGTIIWDDYPDWPDVVRAVDELSMPVIHIAGTGFALLDGPRSKNRG